MEWSRGHVIGHGSSASVSVAVSNLTGGVFAVKSAELTQSDWLQREQQMISTLSSPQIVGYRGCDITRENNKLMFNLMMEYASGGTLGDRNGGLKESMICGYTKQIVKGLEYLHSMEIVHCDIKPDNILIGEDGGVKIADFGCAKRLSKVVNNNNNNNNNNNKLVMSGTPMFMAPEVVLGKEQSFPADIWGLGCTIIAMATGGSPWSQDVTTAGSPSYVLYKFALSGHSPNIPHFLSHQAKDFLDKCLRSDPTQRFTAKQLMEHPFLKKSDAMNVKETQEFDLTSPTSILDNAIWNSAEESSVGWSIQECLESSGMQRIKKLSLNSEKPNWAWEESWVTIRSNESGIRRVGGGEKLINCSSVGYVSYNASCTTSNSSSFLDHRVLVGDINF